MGQRDCGGGAGRPRKSNAARHQDLEEHSQDSGTRGNEEVRRAGSSSREGKREIPGSRYLVVIVEEKSGSRGGRKDASSANSRTHRSSFFGANYPVVEPPPQPPPPRLVTATWRLRPLGLALERG